VGRGGVTIQAIAGPHRASALRPYGRELVLTEPSLVFREPGPQLQMARVAEGQLPQGAGGMTRRVRHVLRATHTSHTIHTSVIHANMSVSALSMSKCHVTIVQNIS
jgi:hypothetical protein